MTSSQGSSVADKLQAQAQARGIDTAVLVNRWVADGLLARLTSSADRDGLIVKGGSLLIVWTGDILRATPNLELGLSNLQETDVPKVASRALNMRPSPHDGIDFDLKSVRYWPLKNNRRGMGMTVDASVGRSRVQLRIDAECQISRRPEPETHWYPRLLPDVEWFQVRAYPRAIAVAEMLARIVEFGRDNTRLRDFYDIWFLSQRFYFLGHVQRAAIETVFSGQYAQLVLRQQPEQWLGALGPSFASPDKIRIWNQWVLTALPRHEAPALDEVVSTVAQFACPLLKAVRDGKPFKSRWCPNRGWLQLVPDHAPQQPRKIRHR